MKTNKAKTYSYVIGLSVLLTLCTLVVLYVLNFPHIISNLTKLKPLTLIVLEYFKVLASWPIATFSSILFISLFFKSPLTTWLSYLKVSYGNLHVSSQLQTTNEDNELGHNIPEQSNTPQPMQPTNNDHTIVTNQADSNNPWRIAAYLWEYRFLNLHLVFNTKRILIWLNETKQVRLDAANAIWAPIIPSLAEREAILKVLLDHHLVQLSTVGNELNITPKGSEFVELMLKS